MGTLKEELAADYAEAIGDYEQTFVWQGEPYPCVRTTAAAELNVVEGGFEEEVSDRCTVAISDLPPGELPEQGQPVDDGTLEIKRVDRNVGHLILWLGPAMNMGHDA